MPVGLHQLLLLLVRYPFLIPPIPTVLSKAPELALIRMPVRCHFAFQWELRLDCPLQMSNQPEE